jgi:FkbM family methyltransferase
MSESFSQFGEDLILWRHFGGKKEGCFVEVGANHPTKLSQTWFFERKGWSGILVEPVEAKAELLRTHRPRSTVVRAAAGAPDQRGEVVLEVPDDDVYAAVRTDGAPASGRTERVPVRTLDDILESQGVTSIDLLSIDVEGMEEQVLRGFDLGRFKPGVVLMEDHLHDLKVHHYLTARGYRLAKRTGCNNWYVPAGAPFSESGLLERLQLWRKIHLNVPLRMWRRGAARS